MTIPQQNPPSEARGGHGDGGHQQSVRSLTTQSNSKPYTWLPRQQLWSQSLSRLFHYVPNKWANGKDELPALARILENLPTDAVGHVMIETAGLESRVSINHPDDVKLEWVDKDNTPLYGWFAGEFSQAQTMRKHFKSFLDKKQQLSVAYWTAT